MIESHLGRHTPLQQFAFPLHHTRRGHMVADPSLPFHHFSQQAVLLSGNLSCSKTCCYPRPVTRCQSRSTCLVSLGMPNCRCHYHTLYGIPSMSRAIKPARLDQGFGHPDLARYPPVLLLSIIPIRLRARVTVNHFEKRSLFSLEPLHLKSEAALLPTQTLIFEVVSRFRLGANVRQSSRSTQPANANIHGQKDRYLYRYLCDERRGAQH